MVTPFFEMFGCGLALGTRKAGPGWSPQGGEQEVPLRTPMSLPGPSLLPDKAPAGEVTHVLQAAA